MPDYGFTRDNEPSLGAHVNPTTNEIESEFREQVRNLLDLSHLTRDEQLFDELRRLKRQDEKLKTLAARELRITEAGQ